MKIKTSLGKALNKSQNGSNNIASKQKKEVYHSSSKKQNDVKLKKNNERSEVASHSFQQQTQNLLERNYHKIKAVQKPVSIITLAPAALVLPQKPISTVFNDIDLLIQKDQPFPKPQLLVHEKSLNESINKFDGLTDCMIESDAVTKQPVFVVHPPAFQLPQLRSIPSTTSLNVLDSRNELLNNSIDTEIDEFDDL
jgi:hypothetical protein